MKLRNLPVGTKFKFVRAYFCINEHLKLDETNIHCFAADADYPASNVELVADVEIVD